MKTTATVPPRYLANLPEPPWGRGFSRSKRSRQRMRERERRGRKRERKNSGSQRVGQNARGSDSEAV